MTDTVRYEVWLPGQDQPEELHYDGDKAARRARELNGVMVKEGTSEEDRKTLLDVKFPPPTPMTNIPAGIEVAAGQARTLAAREALDNYLYDEGMKAAEKDVPKQLADAQKAAERGRKEIEDRQAVHEEAVRISMTEPERYAGKKVKPTPLPPGTEIVGGEVVAPSTPPAPGASTSPTGEPATVESSEDKTVRAKAPGDTKETPAKAEREKAEKADK